MTCLPRSGGCEKPLTDAFVNHLNDAEGACFVHRSCLDIVDRRNPQPEALYVDSGRNIQLVIERKSISSPADFAHRHSNDHFVSDLFEDGLKGIPFDDLYEISLPMLISGTQPQLRAFVLAAVQSIRSHWPIAEGMVLRSPPGKRWWTYRRVPEWNKLDDAPSKGLQFTWSELPTSNRDYIDAANLPQHVTSALQHIYSNCVKKFVPYSNARRILVLDPHGNLRYQGVEWWRDVFSVLPPPTEIDEVWSGMFDWVAENSEGWIFERLHRQNRVIA
jgi:hypothetical protein